MSCWAYSLGISPRKECAAVAHADDVGRCQVRRLIIPAKELIGAANGTAVGGGGSGEGSV